MSLPAAVQLGFLALGGPWLLYYRGLLTVGLLDATIVALTLSLALYLGAAALVGTGGRSRGTC